MARPRTARRVHLGAWATATLLATASACGDDRGSTGAVTTSPAATAPQPSAPSGPIASSAASSTAAPAAPASPWTGSWTGTYRAEKAMPTLDPTVKVKSWSSDDGKRASGEGKLRIDVAPDGEVKGELLGPLGPADVVGIVEGERLLARIVPREEGESSFAGTAEGTLAGDGLSLTLRASDGAAVTVRKAAGTLRR